jgi:hypothetical protein
MNGIKLEFKIIGAALDSRSPSASSNVSESFFPDSTMNE